jgi:hypothetical protein
MGGHLLLDNPSSMLFSSNNQQSCLLLLKRRKKELAYMHQRFSVISAESEGCQTAFPTRSFSSGTVPLFLSLASISHFPFSKNLETTRFPLCLNKTGHTTSGARRSKLPPLAKNNSPFSL